MAGHSRFRGELGWLAAIRTRDTGKPMNSSQMRRKTSLAGRAVGIIVCGALSPAPAYAQTAPKIRHVIVIMQENRSFDHYFGTFPGADGIRAGACVPDPASGTCVAPFHDTSDM